MLLVTQVASRFADRKAGTYQATAAARGHFPKTLAADATIGGGKQHVRIEEQPVHGSVDRWPFMRNFVRIQTGGLHLFASLFVVVGVDRVS